MKIIHLSDLHFGTQHGTIVQDTLRAVAAHDPDLVIISGDFTQIASRAEFELARVFLDRLGKPCFCVAGNHDIPPRNLIERFFNPYKKYQRYIHRDLCPVFENKTIILAGLNSARRALWHWNWANGAISQEQRERLNGIFGKVPLGDAIQQDGRRKWRICTFHHPVHKIQDMPLNVTVFGAKKTIDTLHTLKIDLVLTGHVHHAAISPRGDETHQTVYLSASTAMSSRLRQQENGFNLITLEDDRMMIEIYLNGQDGFYKAQSYEKTR